MQERGSGRGPRRFHHDQPTFLTCRTYTLVHREDQLNPEYCTWILCGSEDTVRFQHGNVPTIATFVTSAQRHPVRESYQSDDETNQV